MVGPCALNFYSTPIFIQFMIIDFVSTAVRTLRCIGIEYYLITTNEFNYAKNLPYVWMRSQYK